MSDETTRAEDVIEHQEKAKEHNPDERPPEERAEGEDPGERGLLGGLAGSAVTTEHEEERRRPEDPPAAAGA